MLEFLKSWVEQIAIAIVIATIFEMILPNGKIKKYVKIVLGVFIVFSIIAPFVEKNEIYNFDINTIETYVEDITTSNEQSTNIDQSTMNKTIEKLYIEELQNDIKSKVEEQGYKVQECKIDAILDEKAKNKRYS